MDNRLLFEQKKKRRPEIWQFIKLVAPCAQLPAGKLHWETKDAKRAYCLKCQKCFPFNSSTSVQVRRHMLDKHQEEMKIWQDHKKQSSSALCTATRGAARMSTPIPIESSGSFVSNVRLGENLLKSCGKISKSRRGLDESAQELITTHLVKWLSYSCAPVSIVHNQCFKDLLGLINDTEYNIPSEDELIKKFEFLKKSYTSELKKRFATKIEHYSLSLEVFKSSTSRENYLLGKIHFIDEDFGQQTFALDVFLLGTLQMNFLQIMENAIYTMIDNWGLDFMKLVMVTHNFQGELKLKKSSKHVKVFPCLANTFFLSCHGFFYGPNALRKLLGSPLPVPLDPETADVMTFLSNIIDRFRIIAEFLTTCDKAKKRLNSIYIQRQIYPNEPDVVLPHCAPEIHLESSGGDNWHGTFCMLRSMIRIKKTIIAFGDYIKTSDGIQEFSSDFEINQLPLSFNFDNDSWLLIHGFVGLIDLINNASVMLSQQNSSMHPNFPLTSRILHHLVELVQNPTKLHNELKNISTLFPPSQQNVVDTQLQIIQKFVYQSILTQYSKFFTAEECWSTVLDPRFAKLSHLSSDEVHLVKKILEEKAISVSMWIKMDKTLTTSRSNRSLNIPVNKSSTNWSFEDMGGWNTLNDMATTNDACLKDDDRNVSYTSSICDNLPPSTHNLNHHEEVKNELDAYFSSLTYCPNDPHLWWKLNNSKFCRLGALARKWLGTATTCIRPDLFPTMSPYNINQLHEIPCEYFSSMIFLNENFDVKNPKIC